MKVDKRSSSRWAKRLEKLYAIFSSGWVVFLLGAIIGIVFFGLFYGYNLLDVNNTSWIFTQFAHDTGQHQLGWEFFACDSTGGRINGLAYPGGIPITFLDSIPFLAFFAKFFGFGATQQYFGLYAMVSYALFGGFAALILRYIFVRLKGRFAKYFDGASKSTLAQFQMIFIALGTLILVVSPLMIARAFYHTALASQGLILLGFLLVLYRDKIFGACKFTKIHTKKSQKLLTKTAIFLSNAAARFNASTLAKFMLIWSAVLVLVVLIHPYFLPMLGALLAIDAVLLFPKKPVNKRREIIKILSEIIIPATIAGAVFVAIGGLSLGGNTGASDLNDKGFNLLSFFWPGGYSALIPATGSIAKSGSPETMMWIGAGVILMLVLAGILHFINRKSMQNNAKKVGLRQKISGTIESVGRAKFWTILAIANLLLLLALSPSIQIGGSEILHYPVPDFVLKLWQDFRAAAREAWPFYYALIFWAIYVFSVELLDFLRRFMNAKSKSAATQLTESKKLDRVVNALTIGLLILVVVQVADVLLSPTARQRAQNFSKIALHDENLSYQFPLNLSGILKSSQKHLVVLDASAGGDISGFNLLGQTAMEYDLTLNVGFFARTPDAILQDQTRWRAKAASGALTATDLNQNLFATGDETLAGEMARFYDTIKVGRYWIIR